ncbi:uncharacterized protein C1orf112 homolog [Sinocyclocheilus anshuiensis]|uniref:uncharacterized protein C1orf112 homolog n=1 Tax=Sinocyclocheilus anshuiensis TaxID=1608454 RepID=UPI0007BA9018|nr:PREDICTED: uncharacterized protein C1orf112 homolog [Sinocyclocheilus anshuiensis]
MTPKQQVEFVEHFPPAQEENLCVWRHTLLRGLCAEARMRVEKEVLSRASVVLQEWQNNSYRMGDIPRLNRILGCVLMLMGGSNLQAECMISSVKIISQLWSCMSSNQSLTDLPVNISCSDQQYRATCHCSGRFLFEWVDYPEMP